MKAEPISIEELAERVGSKADGGRAVVTSITHDSRAVEPGGLFVAVRGSTTDGHDHVAEAIERGAAAIVVDHAMPVAIPQIVVADTRAALAPLSAALFRDPADHMQVVGVTGTNGKTTVTHLLESMANAAGVPAAIVGTVGARIAGETIRIARTTPESSDLQSLLSTMLVRGVRLAAVEVSSHALALHRADAIRFSSVAFTNLSQDHLDFHEDMERYFTAKAALFQPTRAKRAVIFVDDPAGARLAEETALPVTTVSLTANGDVSAAIQESDLDGSVIELDLPGWRRVVRLPLAGRFNVANAAIAAALADVEGIAPDAIAAGLEAVPPIPGRFEQLDEGQPFGVVVDYAHTPDAVATVVSCVRPMTGGRIIVVVGAGGDRDREKRPLMGRAAGDADVAVITSDNPRSEDPRSIIEAVAAGAHGTDANLILEPDRRRAIHQAVAMAEPGDVVLVLGKGHETGQEIAGVVTPFDDRRVAREALAVVRAGDGSAR